MRLATANLQVFEPGIFNHAYRGFHGLRIEGREMAGHPLCFVLSVKSVKSVVNSLFGSGSGLLLILAICLNFIAQTGLAATENPAARARKIFQDAQTRYQKEPRNAEAVWQFARACFDLADLATNNAQRIEVAEKGIAACKQLLSRDPQSAPGHYYLGMNLGQVAQTRGLGALT